MRLARLFLTATLFLVVQYAVNAAPQQAGATPDSGKVEAQLHSDVLKLVSLDNIKQRLQGNLKQLVDSGKAQMQQKLPLCTSAFADEWAKRMLQRINIDDFMNVVVTAFEKHFNDTEIKELIAFRSSKDSTQPAALSPELKQKIEKIMPTIQSEIMGSSVQIGTKLGAEIGQEIQKEHPEYCKESAPANQ